VKPRFKPNIFHSVPEALMYFLLILLLILNIVGLAISSNNAQQAKVIAAQNQVLAATNQANTRQIEQQITCISAFFLLVPNRTSASLNNLAGQKDCAATIKAIQQ
jgi:hypothetical protein